MLFDTRAAKRHRPTPESRLGIPVLFLSEKKRLHRELYADKERLYT